MGGLGWLDELLKSKESLDTTVPVKASWPKAPSYYARSVNWVNTKAAAENMVTFAQQRSISVLGVAVNFEWDRLPVEEEVYDPSSIRPALITFALVERDVSDLNKAVVYRFAVDLRVVGTRPAVASLLELPLTFVGHDLKKVFFCLWKLKLPIPQIVWDTRIAAVAERLGKDNPRYRLRQEMSIAEQIQTVEQLDTEREIKLSLPGVCHAFGEPCGADGDPTTPLPDVPHEALLETLTSGAAAAARIYPHQVMAALVSGTLHHLETVEMPWVRTNARIEWRGVKVNRTLCKRIAERGEQALRLLEPKLIAAGIENFRSGPCLEEFFRRNGKLELFRQGDTYSFERKILRQHMDCHTVMPLLYAARHIHDTVKTGILDLRLIGSDGRMHPMAVHLGTDTGRQVARFPNILGVSKLMRPVVVGDDGRGIGEVDLSQIEVFIVAALYKDKVLLALCNAGDVYCGMAKRFYKDIPVEDFKLPDKEFKEKYGDKRDTMKILTLSVIYGSTAFSIATLLKIKKPEAERILEDFLSMFPALMHRRTEIAEFGAVRGSVSTVSGLRRYRGMNGSPSNWERNWMVNHPVQGSAAVVFKIAGNRLDVLIQEFEAWIIVPFHDAFVFEAPLGQVEQVAELIRQEMIRAVQQVFPELRPRADINCSRSECWNKDSHADSVEQWLKDLEHLVAERSILRKEDAK